MIINGCVLLHYTEPYYPKGKKDKKKFWRPRAKFICPHCGDHFIARIDKVKQGWTRSCGCLALNK